MSLKCCLGIVTVPNRLSLINHIKYRRTISPCVQGPRYIQTERDVVKLASQIFAGEDKIAIHSLCTSSSSHCGFLQAGPFELGTSTLSCPLGICVAVTYLEHWTQGWTFSHRRLPCPQLHATCTKHHKYCLGTPIVMLRQSSIWNLRIGVECGLTKSNILLCQCLYQFYSFSKSY